MFFRSMMTVTALIFMSACFHTLSTVPAITNAVASGVIDHTTAQVSISGVATAEATDSKGMVHGGGFGARVRAIRRGGSRAQANLIVSNWLEAGTWNKSEAYYNSGTTIGYGLGGASWFAGLSFGVQYGGYRTSALLLPVKAHFLYVGRIQLNAEAWTGQRFGDFGSSDPSFTNAMGWSASIGFGGAARGKVSEHRRGFGLGIFSEQMDGVTVTGVSLEWQLSTANIPRPGTGQASPILNTVKCKSGDAAACKEVDAYARRLIENIKTADDITSAVELLIIACDGALATSCTAAGHISQEIKEYEKSMEFYQRGCDGGDMEGCGFFADLTKDMTQKIGFYSKACDGGYMRSCGNLGLNYFEGEGVDKDASRGAALFTRACDGGDMNACFNLAIAVQSGIGVSADDVRALSLFLRSCDGNYARGCTNAGSYISRGNGTVKDMKRAVALLQKGCDQGDMKGCGHLAGNYLAGDGVAKNEARAMELTDKACTGGDMLSCYELGRSYLDGSFGVTKDVKRAAALYSKACDGEIQDACMGLDAMLVDGQIPLDDKAKQRLSAMCKVGVAEACDRLK
jgi:uncharacterized protein